MPRALRIVASLLFMSVAFAAPAAARTVLVYGDSLSAAYGMPEQEGWVALLGARLKRERPDYSVANASISGETSAGGLARLAKTLERTHPAVVILELGANDGLRGLPPAAMQSNLDAMIRRAQQAGAKVLLVGMKLPPNYGPDYTRAFERAFAEAARARRVAFLPFLLEGFAEKQELFQADRVHPSPVAQPKVLDNVWRALAPLLKSR